MPNTPARASTPPEGARVVYPELNLVSTPSFAIVFYWSTDIFGHGSQPGLIQADYESVQFRVQVYIGDEKGRAFPTPGAEVRTLVSQSFIVE